MRRAIPFAAANLTHDAVRCLVSRAPAPFSEKTMSALEALHPPPPDNQVMPSPPVVSPLIVVDNEKLKLLIRRYPRGRAAGPSGWTAELLLPLLEDDVCFDGITLLVQLIANNALDPESRHLLTCSLLLGHLKPDDSLRPLAMGELFLKIAARYCHDLDKDNHHEIFEPLQLALDSQCGAERAMQRTQAAIELNPKAHITLHLDSSLAFNSADRLAMLESVYGDQRLSNSWRVFDFAYGIPSILLVRDHGHVMGTLSSRRGVKQGCVLGSLGFARLVQPVYTSCVDGLNVTAVAIMDDFTVTGPPEDVFELYDRILIQLRRLDISVNTAKTKIQQAEGQPSDFTTRAAAERGLEIVCGNFKSLGGLVGVDDAAAVEWLEAKLQKQSPVTKVMTDSRFPSLLALNLANISHIPKPMYLARALPIRWTAGPIANFDCRNREALLPRLLRSSKPLASSALVSLTQPGANGGTSFGQLDSILPAARWASAAAAASDLQALLASEPPLSHPRSLFAFQLDILTVHGMLVARGVSCLHAGQPEPEDVKVRLANLPFHPLEIAAHYEGIPKLRGLQRVLSLQIHNSRLDTFLDSKACTNADLVRLAACRHKSTRRWLKPSPSFPVFSDLVTTIALRLRLGLPPLDDLPLVCGLCGDNVEDTPWHALVCKKLRRKAVTVRHDRVCQLLCRYARSNDCTAHVVQKDLAHLLPDGLISTFYQSILFDVSGTYPHAPSYIDMAPDKAKAAREAHKVSKYSSYARDEGCSFTPFILDCYGSLGPAALQLLKDIRANALGMVGKPSPFCLSRSAFFTELSSIWQQDNAKIVVQWMTLQREKATRSKLQDFIRSAAPVAAALPAAAP